jgi:hypothetical protein
MLLATSPAAQHMAKEPATGYFKKLLDPVLNEES